MADLGQSDKTVPNVRFSGNPCKVLDQSTVPRCIGDEPGVAGGVISGTVAGEAKPTGASTNVRAGGRWVVREFDPCTLNSGNCPGIYVTVTLHPAVHRDGRQTDAPRACGKTRHPRGRPGGPRERKGIWGRFPAPCISSSGRQGLSPAWGGPRSPRCRRLRPGRGCASAQVHHWGLPSPLQAMR